MNRYLRYFSMWLLLLVAAIGFILGGAWMWLGYLTTLAVIIGGDAIAGDDLTQPSYRHTWLLNLALYGALPLLLLMLAPLAWMTGADGDWLGLGTLIGSVFGWDMQAARAHTGVFALWGGVMSAGLLVASAATNIGHELTHRTSNPFAQGVGRWMLAMTCDTSFSIEHVYGHHTHVCTPRDPATARRGENAWAFVIRSTVGQSIGAWRLERERLAKRGISVWSWCSRMPRGIAMSAVYFALFYWAGGITGLLVFLGTALWGRSLLEFVNYLEHYGLVRVPGTPVAPRHSWNSNKRLSAYTLYNLTRHSHHHAEGDSPFWKLKPYPDAPTLKHGYLTSISIAMVPPLWHRLMIPRLKLWDAHLATPAERALAAEQNLRSGRPELTGENDLRPHAA